MSTTNTEQYVPRCISPIIAYNKRSRNNVYDWIERNMLDYTLFNNIIRDNTPSTQQFIEMYNNLSENEDLPENVFRHFIKVINTNQNTYWGVGPFIKRGSQWKIMMRDDLRFSRTVKPNTVLFDACTQTDE